MARGSPKDEPTAPTSFPATTPPGGPDMSTWLLTAATKNAEAMAKLESTVAGLDARLGRMESKLDTISDEVKGHGRWFHTVKYALIAIAVLIGWIVTYAVGPWVRKKLGV